MQGEVVAIEPQCTHSVHIARYIEGNHTPLTHAVSSPADLLCGLTNGLKVHKGQPYLMPAHPQAAMWL